MSDAAFARLGQLTFLFDQSTGDVIGVMRKDGKVRRFVQAATPDNFELGPKPFVDLEPLQPDAVASLALANITDMSANARTFNAAANYAAMRTALGVALGADVQAYDADLAAIAALASAANKVAYSTGAQAWALADFTAAGRSLVGAADVAAQQSLLQFVFTALADKDYLQWDAGTSKFVNLPGPIAPRDVAVDGNVAASDARMPYVNNTAATPVVMTLANNLGHVAGDVITLRHGNANAAGTMTFAAGTATLSVPTGTTTITAAKGQRVAVQCTAAGVYEYL